MGELSTHAENLDLLDRGEQSSFASNLMLAGLWLVGITIVLFGWPFLLIGAFVKYRERREKELSMAGRLELSGMPGMFYLKCLLLVTSLFCIV